MSCPLIKQGQTTENAKKILKNSSAVIVANTAKQKVVINMIFRHGEVIPNLACILGELNCFSGFWLLFLSNLMIFSIKLGSQIFQNNALVKMPYALKFFSTQENGKNCYHYYWCCKKSGY